MNHLIYLTVPEHQHITVSDLKKVGAMVQQKSYAKHSASQIGEHLHSILLPDWVASVSPVIGETNIITLNGVLRFAYMDDELMLRKNGTTSMGLPDEVGFILSPNSYNVVCSKETEMLIRLSMSW